MSETSWRLLKLSEGDLLADQPITNRLAAAKLRDGPCTQTVNCQPHLNPSANKPNLAKRSTPDGDVEICFLKPVDGQSFVAQ